MPAAAPRSLTPEAVNDAIAKAFPGNPNRCTELSPTHAVASLEVSASSIRPGGLISGPTQFALADAVLWYLVFGVIDRIEPMAVTSELSIRYLRPAQGAVLWARADLASAGRRQVVGSVITWTDDPSRPTSVSQGTYALPRS